MFRIPDPVRTKEIFEPLEKLTDLELFQSLTSELTSPNPQIHSPNEADKAARDCAAPLASAYRISIKQTTILDQIYEMHKA
jgi:hypothetical protein